MPRVSEAQRFDRTIAQLIAKRSQYSKGLAEIDALFGKYGITVNGTAAPARHLKQAPAPSQKSAKRRRGRFAQSGNEFILSLVKSKNNPTTSEIDAAWRKSGRAGKVHNALGILVKDKRLKRTPVKDGRGSSYSVA
jgi:hypothetical protein